MPAARIRLSRPLVHQLRLRYLVVVPVLLAVAAALVLAVRGDVDTPLLYSQCHARARLPSLSRIPVLGAPACFLASVFLLAASSIRGVAQLSVFLSFLAALLTVSHVEAGRACNGGSWSLRRPTLGWLVFSLVGGTVVWDLWVVPAFLKRAKDLRVEKVRAEALEGGTGLLDEEERLLLERSLTTRAEVYAIPLAVAVGFVVPSVLMLVLKDVVSVIVWLFFPLWVGAVHWAVKFAAVKLLRDDEPLYLDSHPPSVTLVYALPFIASLLSHALFIWNLFCKNDSRQMTRAALQFIGIDFSFIAATVLYWVFIESGVIPTVLMVVFTVFLGPGAALCLTWLVRDKAIVAFAVSEEEDGSDEESDGDDSTVHEDTPLLN
ncbi:hypothetical protein GGS24DRAFT_492305 [Hypoxylon argillaceum]|nr:hypothetical protein GGS24DRAFT_492305 [Hypoxylon argillaceum]KAI1150303.1 hypothetical protein F4825DRAFT_427303 [Nemania diffusa]